ncbi:hypothetical protein PIIN_10036 [Serendipita indica DSM 11827]|uniref:Chitin synthase n=1 Tax=Serendipita indica (strain DSM 11827) TaxID=1109443 RepID=G4TXJ3_SERID|nr:hypothetical protein PIIN_10036 [Serendipita indica DSM 11827]
MSYPPFHRRRLTTEVLRVGHSRHREEEGFGQGGDAELPCLVSLDPQRVHRRYKNKKPSELFHRNLVIDNQAPSKLLDMFPQKTETEFKFMRLLGIYLMIICAIRYTEEAKARGRQEGGMGTGLQGKWDDNYEKWQQESRQEAGVDGAKVYAPRYCSLLLRPRRSCASPTINSRTLSIIPAMTAYQDCVAKDGVNDKPVTAHTYEYTDDREAG